MLVTFIISPDFRYPCDWLDTGVKDIFCQNCDIFENEREVSLNVFSGKSSIDLGVRRKPGIWLT